MDQTLRTIAAALNLIYLLDHNSTMHLNTTKVVIRLGVGLLIIACIC